MTIFARVNSRGRGKLGDKTAQAGCARPAFVVWNALKPVYNIRVARPATERPLILAVAVAPPSRVNARRLKGKEE